MKISDEQLKEVLKPFFGGDHVRIENFGAFRKKQFKGLVADHALNLICNNAYGKDLLVVFIKRISNGPIEVINHTIEMTGRPFQWMLIDYSGECSESSEEIDVDRIRDVVRSLQIAQGEPAKTKGSLFTANNEWLLKIILLGNISDRFWGGPRMKGFSRLNELVFESGLPQPTVSRFVSLGEQHGFLSRDSNGIRFHRLREMFREWAFVHHLRRKKESVVKVDSLYPGESVGSIVDRLLQGNGCILGGHYAAQLLGVGRSNVSNVIAYVEDIDSALEKFELTQTSSTQSDVTLVSPQSMRFIKKGAPGIQEADTGKVTDVIQIYLDLFHSLDRGMEQAEFIFENVLADHFREEKWL